MHFFHLVGEFKILGNGGLAFGLGVLDHFGIHLGEFVGFTFQSGLQIGGRVADLARVLEMRVGVNGFSGGGGAEQLGDLRQAFLVGHLGESKIFAVGLGLTGESGHQIFLGLAHCLLLLRI